MKKAFALAGVLLFVTLLNWMLFACLTGMFQQPLELSGRNGGRCIASYPSPGGTYRADVFLYDETSLSLAGLRLWVEETTGGKGRNIAYMYGTSLFPYGDAYHELQWLDDTTLRINGVVLDVRHMTYIE